MAQGFAGIASCAKSVRGHSRRHAGQSGRPCALAHVVARGATWALPRRRFSTRASEPTGQPPSGVRWARCHAQSIITRMRKRRVERMRVIRITANLRAADVELAKSF